MVQGQFINDKQVLLKAAQEAGVEGAQQLLDSEDELKSEVGRSVHGLFVATVQAAFSIQQPSCIALSWLSVLSWDLAWPGKSGIEGCIDLGYSGTSHLDAVLWS